MPNLPSVQPLERPQQPLHQPDNKRTVLAFGSFDPIHEGHLFFLQEARNLGEQLIVVVATDEAIRTTKQHEPHQTQEARVEAVAQLPVVTKAMLGDKDPNSYQLLRTIDFTILALGYDQKPSDEEVVNILKSIGKEQVAVVRINSHEPHRYKSSLIKSKI